MYSDTILEHFQSPRNVGELEQSDADADDENPVCGDRIHLWLRIHDGVIVRAGWKGDGCTPALAAASVVSEMLQGMSVDQARALSRDAVAGALGGLPARKAHAAALAVSVVHKAIVAYDLQDHSAHN
ncbi:MAG TPA: iron-sulfur cluster assembly scaffold protein [Chloroflexota bacterium]